MFNEGMTAWGVAARLLLLGLAAALSQSAEGQEEPAGSVKLPPAMILAEADELAREGGYTEALERYASLIDAGHLVEKAVLGRAQTLMIVGQYDEALSLLDEHVLPDSADWHSTRAELFNTFGKYDEAIETARKAIELRSDSPRARLLIGVIQEQLGRLDEAIETYRWFDRQLVSRPELPRDPEWLTFAGLGFLRYSELTRTNIADRTRHVLNDMLQPAYARLDRTYWPARVAAADLLRSRYNNSEENGSISDYQAALRVNERLPEAFVGLGFVALDQWNFEETDKQIEQALAINPRLPAAHHLRATKLIVERRYEEAITACDPALKLNPNDLQALSLVAAARACQFDDAAVAVVRERIESIAPRTAILPQALGNALSGIRQYAASERELQRAVELAPADANARTELGLMYMQWGREEPAREALETAFQIDPFNQRTKFTLDLLDSLQDFARIETDHVVVRFDKRQDALVGEAVARYFDEIHPAVTGDFETRLEEKTIVEIFPTQREFAVRITGQPWIHTIGACTGRIIALASPRKAVGLNGPYHFANVLRHEFTHTVTLAATRNRIPHWFTEGLAVLQEDTPRSYEWMQLLAEAVRRDALFTLESVSWAFVRPKKATDRQQAYAQSEWMCEYIIERFGYPAILGMLEGFHAGRTEADVFRNLLEVDPEQFDQDFATWARQQATAWGFDLHPPESVDKATERLEQNPDSAEAKARLALALYDAGDLHGAMVKANEALEADESELLALKTVADVTAAALDQAGSASLREELIGNVKEQLERLLVLAPEDCRAPRLLGLLALGQLDLSRARELFEKLQRFCPRDPTSWRGLAAVYLHDGDDDRALQQLLEVARTEERDADIAGQIARILRRKDRLPDALYWSQQALYIDPYSLEHRIELGRTLLTLGRNDEALEELLRATSLEGATASHFELAAATAHKLGRRDLVDRLARRAVELDPHSSAASLLSD